MIFIKKQGQPAISKCHQGIGCRLFTLINFMYKPYSLFNQLIALLCLLASATLTAQSGASLSGRVLSESNTPLEAVNIQLEGTAKGATTTADGAFLIEGLEAGNYTLLFSSVGYEQTSRKINLKAGEQKQIKVALRTTVTSLSEIYVRGEALKAENSTITVDVITLNDIRSLNIEQPLRLIEQVPGVDLVAYRQGGVADQFSIRGFGGGGHAGEAEVTIDGVSLNEAEGHSDGYADLNVLIPLNLKSMKVYKGPSSVLFGRFAQGGTLALDTRKGGDYQDFSFTASSFNTLDAQFALGREMDLGERQDAIKANLAFQLFRTDGYAENANVLRGNIAGRIGYQITDKTDIALSLRGHGSEWNAPGYIGEEQFLDEDRRRLQDPNGENDGGAKSFYSQRLDLNHSFNDGLRLLVFGYAVQQEFTRFAKFGSAPGGQTERFNTRDVYAAGASLNGNARLLGSSLNWIAGLEYYSEETDRMRWATSDRIRQRQTEDRLFTIQSVSAYAQGEWELSRYFRPSVGLRYDTYNGSFMANDPGQAAVSDDIDGLYNVSPKVGIRSTVYSGVDLRASVSNGFSLPNSALKYTAGIDLGPVQLWQYEVGATYRPLEWLEVDAAGFVLNTTNEIVENPPGSLEFINAGKTQRTGIETKASISPVNGLSITGTFSYIETEILDNPENTLEGKGLVGIPQTITTLNLTYTLPMGIGANYRFRDVGEYFISNDNAASYEGYTVSHLAVFYNFNKQSANDGRLFFEIQNLFDARYAESVFGSVDARSFAPAPPRNYSFGISYNF